MTNLGRYEIIDKIGRGSMGIVYRARDIILDRQVALKTIRTGNEVEPELRERFYREARACARLQHPNIIIVHDLGEVRQMAYIAMELLEGLDLHKIVTDKVQLPLEVKIEAMAQICEALAYAHAHGIIHRDIKPSNLFLMDMERAKVLDFGIARLPSSHLTVAGKILGTPNYMAPEQILAKPSDARSDLFSAAVVFFEFLTFSHPFKSQLIPRRIVEGEPDSLFDHDSKLPLPLESIFSKALSQDPAARYQRGDEFAADLRAVMDAFKHNESSSFSGMRLPSAREITPAPVVLASSEADLSLLRPVPAGEDAHEWRFSEVLRLIPEFEQALDVGNTVLARKILAQLEAVEAVDHRFLDAVDLCRKRVASTPKTTESLQPPHLPSPPQDTPFQPSYAPPPKKPAPEPVLLPRREAKSTSDSGVPKYCTECGIPNRAIALYCIRCGISLQGQSIDPPSQSRPAPSPASLPSDPPHPNSSLPSSRPYSSQLQPSLGSSIRRQIDPTMILPKPGTQSCLKVPEQLPQSPGIKQSQPAKISETWTDFSTWTVIQKQIAIAALGLVILTILLVLLVALLRPGR